jgi:hypothetical protein
MKIKPRCVPCLLQRVIYEADLVGASEKQQQEVIQQTARSLLDEYGPERASSSVATEVHRLAYELLGSHDPYAALKQRSNEMAQRLLPAAEAYIEESDDPLKAAVICSIVGNSIDFGIAGSATSPEELEQRFASDVKQDLQHDDIDRLRSHLSGDVLYFTDNCGEIVFDRLVCRELKRHHDVSLTLVVKGEPILTDATMDDAEALRFDEVVDDIATTGGFAIGVDMEVLPARVRQALDDASLVIAKGMANYEAFSETAIRPIAYLLKVKCKSIAEAMDMPLDGHVVKVYG